MIKFEILEGVGKITLNRPEKYHSFVREMALKLQDILNRFKDDDNVRAIMITASGKAFCAGQDLAEAIDPSLTSISTIIQEHYNPIIKKIRTIEKPIVAAVNGVAAGAGASIALACDIVVAKESATFVQAFSKIGLVPDSGGTFILPRLVGMQKAAALMMTGEPVIAKDAENMGMIYKSYADDSFEIESWRLVSKLAKMPTKGLGLTKRLLNASANHDIDTQLNMEDECQVIAADTADFKEGVQAFLEKRKPKFKGK
jgi:2-(1,2-epoxy-1,2-dihydrophenyl)acetyl-CoA isomerase